MMCNHFIFIVELPYITSAATLLSICNTQLTSHILQMIVTDGVKLAILLTASAECSSDFIMNL